MVNLQLDDSHKAVIGGKSTSTGNAISIHAIPVGTVNALTIAIVDGSGNQITTFGGGTQYVDANAAATHPTGTGIIFNNGGTYNFVSAAQPLPITGSISATNPSVGSTGSGVPASATYIGFNSGGNLTAVTLGQQTAANSIPVILPSATITTLTPPSNTGYALDSSLSTIDTDLKANITLHSGTNIIGKVTTDQTTHGTTDLVAADITKIGGSALTIGQQLAAASIPVILPSATITTLTPPAAITGFALESGGNLATISGAIISQEATTSGVKGITVFGAVTTAKPTYSTTKSDALSLDTNGLLRVSLADTPANGSKFLVTADAITIASAQTLATVTTVGTVTTITNNVNVIGTLTNNNAAPAGTNIGALTVLANAAQPSWTEGDQVLLSATLKGNLRNQIMDAAGNNRGANVTANNELQVLPTKKDTFAAASTFTITLASLTNSTAGVGRQSTLVTSNTAQSAFIACKITMGTTPTANSLVYVYLLRGDGTLNDDNAGSSDAGLTVINASLLGTILCSAATSNATYYGFFDTKFLGSLGPTFGIAVVNSTGATFNATAGNFSCEYTLIT